MINLYNIVTYYVTIDNHCYKFYQKNEHVIKEIAQEYYCEHEEADTKMLFHITKTVCKNIVIRTSDTDIAVIALAHVDQFKKENKLVWMETGQISNNSLRYINLTKIQGSLGSTLSQALPAFHAFSGCDYEASFYDKGKKKPFAILKNI